MTAPRDRVSRNRLRTATQSAHARVDACFPEGLHDHAAYRCYLRGMHALVAAVEHGLAAATLDATWSRWRRPQRIDALLADLQAVGAPALSGGPALPINARADAAGVLYVLEGSALGATQLVGDALALGWTATHGARFLHEHGGSAAGERWRTYVESLEEARFDGDEEHAMLDAAARAFAYAEHEFLRAARHEGSND